MTASGRRIGRRRGVIPARQGRREDSWTVWDRVARSPNAELMVVVVSAAGFAAGTGTCDLRSLDRRAADGRKLIAVRRCGFYG